jgi:Leucine-rich repeat (LRR) protein
MIRFDLEDPTCTELQTIPSDVDHIRIVNTPLRRLPILPPYLDILFCKRTELETLPELPTSLVHMTIDQSKITTLPKLPHGFRQIWCSYNPNLTHLPPELPSTLITFVCIDTPITTLPPLPDGLTSLSIDHTYIKQLPPVLPLHLRILSFQSCGITTLPELPSTLTIIRPNGSCLPVLIYETENMKPYVYYNRVMKFKAFIAGLDEYFTMKRITQRCKIVKQELIEYTWHPSRILTWCGVDFGSDD